MHAAAEPGLAVPHVIPNCARRAIGEGTAAWRLGRVRRSAISAVQIVRFLVLMICWFEKQGTAWRQESAPRGTLQSLYRHQV